MSRKNRKNNQLKVSEKPQSELGGENSPSMPKNSQFKIKSPKSKIGIALVLSAILAVGSYFLWQNSAPKRTNKPIGTVTNCQKVPPFVSQLGFAKMPALSTSEKSHPGLWLIEAGTGGRKYQHESWKKAGYLAPIERDKEGNIFVAPAPFINILENPPQEQNAVWQIDGKTQEMTKFIDLPNEAKLNEQNAYGALDLAYDCETESLYVSSVFGSNREREIGAIYRIDTKNRKIASVFPKVDAFGLGVFNSAKGKRLYYGLARKPEVWSIDLDDNGNFFGTPRKEISLETLGTRGDDKARKLSFTPGEIRVFGIEFNFNLVAPTEKQETVYRFAYDIKNDTWQFLPAPPQEIR